MAQTPNVDSATMARITALETQVTQLRSVLGAFLAAGLKIIPGNGVPSNSTLPAKAGSLYIRLDGTNGARYYVRQEGNTWSALPGV